MELLTSGALASLIEKFTPAIESGSANVMSVAAIRDRLGDRWTGKRDQIDTFVQRAVAKATKSAALVSALNEVEFMIVQPGAPRQEALAITSSVLKDTLDFYLGDTKAGDIQIFQVVGFVDGQLDLEPVHHGLASASDEPSPAASKDASGRTTDGTPTLRENLRGFTNPVRLVVDGEAALTLNLSIEPVWNINQRVVTSHALIPQVMTEETGERIDIAVLSRHAATELTLATLEQATTLITEGLAHGTRFAVHIPAPLAAVLASGTRFKVLKALNDLPEDLRKLLVLDLCGHLDGLPNSRMSELVAALAPSCRAVLARAPSMTSRLQDWQGCRLNGISLDCSVLVPSDPRSQARLTAFAQAAGQVSKTIVGHSLPSRSVTLAAWAAGFSHLSGAPIQLAGPTPQAVRWTPANLYREMTAASIASPLP